MEDLLMGAKDRGTGKKYSATIRNTGSNATNGEERCGDDTSQTARGDKNSGKVREARGTRADILGTPKASNEGGKQGSGEPAAEKNWRPLRQTLIPKKEGGAMGHKTEEGYVQSAGE